MKAMIFAAGLGTRLAPLTDNRPKALVPVRGRPMLEWVIRRLIAAGFDDIVINLHHHAGMISDFLKTRSNFGVSIHLSFEDALLDTGGGIKQAAHWLKGEKAFLVHNADILSTINLKKMYDFHNQNMADVTLAVRDRKTSRYLLFDREKNLCGWESVPGKEKIITRPAIGLLARRAFCGIHVISSAMLDRFGDKTKFSIIDSYLKWAPEYKIQSYDTEDSLWADLGSPEKLRIAENVFPPDFFNIKKSTS